MSTKTDSEIARETLQRVIRTETRLCTMATKMGIEIKDEDDIRVLVDERAVALTTLDVPFTSVIKAARRSGLHGRKVRVYMDGEYVGELSV